MLSEAAVSVVELKISGERESTIALKVPKSVSEDSTAAIEVMVSAGAWTATSAAPPREKEPGAR